MTAHSDISSETRRYRFADLTLDTGQRRLWRSDKEIRLSKLSFDFLRALVEAAPNLLTHDQLAEKVWGPRRVITPENLSQRLMMLRHAIDEQAERPRYIEAVRGQGYRLIPDLETGSIELATPTDGTPPRAALNKEDDGDSTPPQPDASQTPAPRETSRRRGWPIAAALLVGATLGAASLLSLPPAPAPTPHTLAVLPFQPLTLEEQDPMLEFGMVDTLITQLSQAHGLIVSPYSSVRGYAAIDDDPIAAGRKLGVQSVLEGHVNLTGDRLRVSVRLIDTTNGSTRWAHQFDESAADVQGILDAITANVVTSLPGDIVSRTDIHALRPASSDAFNSYATGRFHLSQRTVPDLEEAIEYFKDAIARDPRYTLAYSGLADCYAVLAVFGGSEPHAAFAKAREAAKQALDLDPDLAEAHTTMGHIHVQYDLDWAAGEREYRSAIRLNPQYALTYMWLGMLYNYRGKFDEALENMRKAQELEPGQKVFSSNIGNALYHARRYDEAVEQLQHTLDMDENFDLALAFLGRAYLHRGDVNRAIESFTRRRSQLLGKDSDLVQAYAMSGRHADADALLAEMHERAKTSYVSPYDFASAYIGLGEQDMALRYLEQAIQDRAQHIGHMPQDPAFDPLHGDPRFERLVERLAL